MSTSEWYNPNPLEPHTRATAEQVNAEFDKIKAAFDRLPSPSAVGTGGGAPNYTHFAYADSADGTQNFTTGAAGNRAYIGIRGNQTSPIPSPYPEDYTWSRLRGYDGVDGQDGSDGGNGQDGQNGLSAFLTNENITLFAYADGSIVSYDEAVGQFKVLDGTTDVSSNFSLSTLYNDQALTIGYSAQSFAVTGGFDINESTANVTIRATGSGPYTGIFLNKVLSLSKAKGGYEIVDTLPTTRLFEGRVVFLTSNGKLYRYHAGGWTAEVPTVDLVGQIVGAQIATGAINTAKFAAGIQPVTIWTGGSLPSSYQTNALTFNGKLYRWNGAGYVTTVDTSDLSGTITSTQISDDAITTPKLAANAITGAKIAANTITGANIAADTITAGQIAAGAISTSELAAGAVIASKVTITNRDDIFPDRGFTDLGWHNLTSAPNVSAVAGSGYAQPARFLRVGVGSSDVLTPAAPVEVGATYLVRLRIFVSSDFAGWIGTSVLFPWQAWENPAPVTTDSSVDGGGYPIVNLAAITRGQWLVYETRRQFQSNIEANNLAIRHRWNVTAGYFEFCWEVVRATSAELIVDGAVISRTVAAEAITADKIAADAITANKILAGAITTDKISAGAITAAKLASTELITISAQIRDAIITSAKIQDAAITTAKIGDAQITTAKIANAQITSAKIGDGEITTAKIGDAQITTAKIGDLQVGSTKIANGAITTEKLTAGAITADKIAANAVRVQNLLVAPNNINPDSLFQDEAFWSVQAGGWYFEQSSSSSVAIALGYTKYMALWSGAYAGTARRHVWGGIVSFSGRGQRLRLRARCGNYSNQVLWVFAEWFDLNGNHFGGTYPTVAAGIGEVTLNHIFEVPANVSGIRVGFCNEAPGSAFSGVMAVTDIRLDVAADASLIVDGEVGADKIAANAVTAGKIAAGQVNATHIAADSIDANRLQAGAVTAGKLAATNVITSSAQIADAVITSAKIGDAAITNAKIGNLQVDTLKIAGNAITSAVTAGATAPTTISKTAFSDAISFTITTTGGPVLIFFTGQINLIASGAYDIVKYRILRNGSVVYGSVENWFYADENRSICLAFLDGPSPGTNTYSIEAYHQTSGSGGSTMSQRYFFAMETKR